MAARNPMLVELVDDDPERVVQLLGHPAQQRMVEVIEWLLEELAGASTPQQLYAFQVALFRQTHRTQEAFAALSRAVKRAQAGKTTLVPDDWPMPGAASSDVQAWEFQRTVAERLVRQLKVVGDALAWKVYGYDRRKLLALSGNASPGQMVGKAGLHGELGWVQARWQEHGRFALLHDLTDVLRVADVTECFSDGYRRLVELKSSERALTSKATDAQMRRIQAAVDAFDGRGPLPGTGEQRHLLGSSVQLRTDLRALEDLARDAAARSGTVSRKLRQGRVVSAFDLQAAAASGRDPLELLAEQGAFRDRQLASTTVGARHVLRMRVADLASRRTALAPLSVFPLSARLRARLICDQVVMEVRQPIEQLVLALQGEGCDVEVLLPDAHSTLTDGTDVLAVRLRRAPSRRLVVHGPQTMQMLLELVDVRCWARACREMLELPEAPQYPVLTFANEQATWRASTSRGSRPAR